VEFILNSSPIHSEFIAACFNEMKAYGSAAEQERNFNLAERELESARNPLVSRGQPVETILGKNDDSTAVRSKK
jgi:hypothetical protein